MSASQSPRRVCLLTGGGDAPGLNAALHALVLCLQNAGIDTVASVDGFDGLVSGRIVPLDRDRVRDVVALGGSVIGCSNRGNPFAYPCIDADGAEKLEDRSPDARANLVAHAVDAVIALGGDGTMGILRQLAATGVACIGVPKTIDNDLPSTDVTIGFDTAVAFATGAIDRLLTTAAAHSRVMIVEVMGRDAGWIALESGLAGGAHAILIPEIPYDATRIVRKITALERDGVRHTLIVVAEGAKPRDGSQSIAEQAHAGHAPRLGGAGDRLRMQLGWLLPTHDVRVNVLGHLQRGGTPTAVDRNLGLRFGAAAAGCGVRGQYDVMVSVRQNQVVPVPLATVGGAIRAVPVDGELCAVARSLEIELGG